MVLLQDPGRHHTQVEVDLAQEVVQATIAAVLPPVVQDHLIPVVQVAQEAVLHTLVVVVQAVDLLEVVVVEDPQADHRLQAAVEAEVKLKKQST